MVEEGSAGPASEVISEMAERAQALAPARLPLPLWRVIRQSRLLVMLVAVVLEPTLAPVMEVVDRPIQEPTEVMGMVATARLVEKTPLEERVLREGKGQPVERVPRAGKERSVEKVPQVEKVTLVGKAQLEVKVQLAVMQERRMVGM